MVSASRRGERRRQRREGIQSSNEDRRRSGRAEPVEADLCLREAGGRRRLDVVPHVPSIRAPT